ncbi:ATP-binding protein [Haloquadratum walsbyi]|uniref:AAA-type ATPase core domain protein n=1 Tax=Haloquadratum walsbyi (strain DSM 16790 / HBSQ001) TaxID=362976 RepID=Q18F65_HALWD|nr:ATP-binding protein [Haloquadratum walsbyi]CAJ53394.1 AAA-type ATPase core domain protein [Haloquadratum walsbyi DSM 16790]
MSEEKLALVNEIADDGSLIVGYRDGSGSATVSDLTDDAEVGDLVKIEETISSYQDDKIEEVVKKRGYDRGRTIGVVESVFDENLAVRTENGLIEINRPDEPVEEGYTIALTHSQSFSQILGEDPIEIGAKPDLEIDAINLNIGSDEESPEEESDEDGIYKPDTIDNVEFDDVIGLQEAKDRLTEAVSLPMEKPDEMERFDLEGRFGILFYGPPGTGKTMLAKAAANEWGSADSFFHIGGPEIVSKYYGESERQIREVFNAAKKKGEKNEEEKKGEPAVVFIDEIDSVVPRRDRADETERRIVAQLLSELDGLEDRGNIIVIGATNLIEVIDPAVRRPGRFDEEIEFTLPEKEERREILEVHSDDMPVSSSVSFQDIAERTRGWSGADLESIVKKAGLIAVKEERPKVEHEDFVIALERFDEQREAKHKQIKKVREQE